MTPEFYLLRYVAGTGDPTLFRQQNLQEPLFKPVPAFNRGSDR